MASTFKRDIRLGVPEDSVSRSIADSFREAHLAEESGYTDTHKDLFTFISKNIDRNLLEIIGYIDNIPIGYAGFTPCGCGCGNRLRWSYMYIPVKLRKYGLGLRFSRTVIKKITELVDKETIIEVSYQTSNDAMSHIFRYAGFEKTVVTGELAVGKILTR
jgi:hypothetical protein